MAQEQYYCKKCNRTMNADQFYQSNNLEKYPEKKLDICKKCLCMHVDNWDPDTYMWILQECDVPYVPAEWNKLMATYAKDPTKVTNMTIIGRYLAKMKLKQHKEYRWKDTEFLQQLEDSKTEQTMKRQGYSTADITMALEKNKLEIPEGDLPIPDLTPVETGRPQTDLDYFAAINDVIMPAIELTDEDKIYLNLKWGKQYRPDEWVALEQLYEEMMQSYDIQAAGDINTLKLACKCSLKANQLLDMGDMEGAQKATKMYDNLMKSGKWTAQQIKENENDMIDSIGELVSICEAEGFIPKFYTDSPQDKVDRVIEDLKFYTKELISNETGIETMIEQALKQIEEENSRGSGEDEEPDDEDALMNYDIDLVTDDDFAEFNDFNEALTDADAELLADIVKGSDF